MLIVENKNLLMKLKLITLFSVIHLMTKSYTQAQNTRISDPNTVAWFGFFGTIKLNKKLGLHTEYQLRRSEFLREAQQDLLRVGVNYALTNTTQLRVGYAWAETFPYGDIPINGMGKDFTEHRTYQMLTLNGQKVSKLEIQHRLMLEQRWIGRYTSPTLTSEDDWVFLNRLRYMMRLQIPLKGDALKDKTPYAAVYDEILIGFGKNVNENVFDQNRLGILLGYRFNGTVRVEGGYLGQILQLGREVNNQNVFQYNEGLVLNTFLNF
jgi:Protein of unknown function (DUF2490)